MRPSWSNLPLAERKRLLAASDDVDVCYDGAGFDSWNAPEGGWRAHARVVRRTSREIEVKLLEDLKYGAAPYASLGKAGSSWFFTNGGMHRDRPYTTYICVPRGWGIE